VTYCPEGHAACVYCLLQYALHQDFETCPVCRTTTAVPGDLPFIYLRQTQDVVVSLMEGIAREFRDVPSEDELRSYACGPIRDNWQVRSR
jgi:hypothetical protein